MGAGNIASGYCLPQAFVAQSAQIIQPAWDKGSFLLVVGPRNQTSFRCWMSGFYRAELGHSTDQCEVVMKAVALLLGLQALLTIGMQVPTNF